MESQGVNVNVVIIGILILLRVQSTASSVRNVVPKLPQQSALLSRLLH
jgi:hypothetical protein